MVSEDTKQPKTKFAADIEKAWQGACETYLTQSGIHPQSEEWKFVRDTTDPQQVVDVIIETWAHYRNPSGAPHSANALSSRVKTTGFIAASKKGFNRLIGRKQSWQILSTPSSSHRTEYPTVDDRVDLQQKLSAKPPKGKDFVDTGLGVTEQIQGISESDDVKTIVETVVKFSDGLQALTGVLHACAPYVAIALGCIRLFFKAAQDLWESYDIIKSIIIVFDDIQNRIQLLKQVDTDLTLSIVYMEAFGYFIEFIAILTRYARDKKLINYVKRFGGPDDELRSIREKLTRFQQKENVYASIENLRVSVLTNDAVARIECKIGNMRPINILSENIDGIAITETVQQWLVPYERNPLFTGRKDFLKHLHERLLDESPKRYNHRIAIYGMGGVGKTQIALQYVYDNEKNYSRIYWISAVDQASLLLGYQNIARMTGLKSSTDSGPDDHVKKVLQWLRQEQNWLLVVDNLDDVKIIKGFLPENGPRKHTIITTRNPNTYGIPAEGQEVPVLDSDDAIELLSTLSNVTVEPGSQERMHATLIVDTLGKLPLAIEQAGAYIREAPGLDFSGFLKHYEMYRKDLHNWLPEGNRQYSFSVATTWSMSFNIVRKEDAEAVKLLQLLSFLNPDGILIDFLLAGADAVDAELRQVISNPIRRAQALLQLARFSLIKLDKVAGSIVIHRLVQAVIRDEMSEKERMVVCDKIVDICDESFPKEWNNDTRPLCRIYFGQVLAPLLNIKTLQTMRLADTMERIGYFLRNDGKYNDRARLLQGVIEIRAALSGADDQSTLTSINNLALTYGQQGKLTEAAKMHEKVLAKYRAILGEDHPFTLTSMDNLALTYGQQGKLTEAAKMHEDVLTKKKVILGDDHPSTLTSVHNLAETYRQQGKLTEAAKMHEDVLTKTKVILGDDHPDTLTSMHNLAETYGQQGKLTEAAKMQNDMQAFAEGNSNGDLPPGWERRYTDNNRPYYVNHNTRTTSWTIPFAARLPSVS